MKKHFLLLTIAILTLKVGHTQTNVSGGIYTNTTWTLTNSPYIVVDTVVVFPGVTLTIQSGVIVKFDNNVRLEIRQANLIAIGTATDSITFTSNSGSPYPGIWNHIILSGNNASAKCYYCNFSYADIALYGFANYSDSIIVNHSNFYSNNIGLNNEFGGIALIDSSTFKNNTSYALYIDRSKVNYCSISNNQNGIYGHTNTITNTRVENSSNVGIQPAIGASAGGTIDNCEIVNNQYGIVSYGAEFPKGKILNSRIDSNNVVGITLYGYIGGDTIRNCQITNNGVGILDTICFLCYGGPDVIYYNVIEYNMIGIKVNTIIDTVYCNRICNNSNYNLYYNLDFNNNISVPYNYWCTTDSATVRSTIYDGYVNINKGLVYFMPLDTEQCYLVTGIPINEFQKFSFDIFPNPFSSTTTLQTNNSFHNATLTVVNCFGQTVVQIKNISGQTVTLQRNDLPAGLYFVRLTEKNKQTVTKKIIIAD